MMVVLRLLSHFWALRATPFGRRFLYFAGQLDARVAVLRRLANHLSSRHHRRFRIASPLLRMRHKRPERLYYSVAVDQFLDSD